MHKVCFFAVNGVFLQSQKQNSNLVFLISEKGGRV